MLFKSLALTPFIPAVLSAYTGVATFNNYAAQSKYAYYSPAPNHITS